MSPQLKPRVTTGPLEGIDRIMGLFFGRKNKPIQGDRLETVIGPSTRFTGDLSVDGGVRIDGQFEGSLEAGGNIVVGEQGRVVADISARHITVSGAVKGNVRATGRLEILKTGHVFGDIHASQVLIDDGGVFQGMSLLGAKDLPALAAPAHDALHPLRDVDPAEVEAQDLDVAEEATAPSEPVSDDIVDADLEALNRAKAKTADQAAAESPAQPKAQTPDQEKPKASKPSKTKKKAEILRSAAKKPKRLPKIGAKARRAGGLGRGLDLNPLDGDLEIEPIIPELGEPSPSEPGRGTEPSSKDGKASGASNGRKSAKRKSSNRNRRKRRSR